MTKPGPTPEGDIVRDVFGADIKARWVNRKHEGRFLYVEGDVENDDDWEKIVEVHRRLPDTEAKIVLASLKEIREYVEE